MKIILGSKNPSKKQALEEALGELGFNDLDIICVDSSSNVNSKPIGYEIIRGADNRNQESKKYAFDNNIQYDYLVSLEGGFSLDENGLPFVVTYTIVEDVTGKKSTGKSLGIRLRKDMFDYIKNGGSLNKLIEQITKKENNKQDQEITGYLTNGLFNRSVFDKDSVISAFIPIIFKEQRDILSEKIKETLLKEQV